MVVHGIVLGAMSVLVIGIVTYVMFKQSTGRKIIENNVYENIDTVTGEEM